MKKWFPKLPKDVTCMSMSACGRYVYALAQTVYVFDRETGGKQRLPQLGNSEPVPSPCGRFIAAAHPCRTAATQLEVSIWQVGPEHRELFPRVRVPHDTVPPIPASRRMALTSCWTRIIIIGEQSGTSSSSGRSARRTETPAWCTKRRRACSFAASAREGAVCC